MRQAVMTAPGIIEFREADKPDLLKEKEILLRIRRIGVCGSDIHVYHGKHPATPYPVIQGHEYSGVVEAVGSAVTIAKAGMHATARPQLVCGKCGPCLRGQYNACQNLRVQGFQAPGVAQDYFVVEEDRLVIIPDSMSLDQGAMVEPASVGVHATGRARDLKGKNVVVSGAGTIGNLVAQFAKARGARKVLITDMSEFRLARAKECGIDEVLNLKQTSFTEGVEKCFGKEGFQAGFEAAGVQSSLDVLIENVEKGGDVIIVGVYSKNPVVNMYYVGEHELNLFGSMMYLHEDYLLAVDLIASGKIKTMPLITDRFPFEKYREAYQYIESRGDKTLKVIIEL